jgi:hypothetical protein
MEVISERMRDKIATKHDPELRNAHRQRPS